MVKVIQQYGAQSIMVNSAADWGISDPLAVPKTAALMKMNGIPDIDIKSVTYQNAITAFGQSGQIHVEDFKQAKPVDHSATFNGTSILRGGQQPDNTRRNMIIN